MKLFTKYLKPAFDSVNIQYTEFITESPTYVQEWVSSDLVNDFTDFVLIGGDGLFSQFVNAIYSSKPDLIT